MIEAASWLMTTFVWAISAGVLVLFAFVAIVDALVARWRGLKFSAWREGLEELRRG